MIWDAKVTYEDKDDKELTKQYAHKFLLLILEEKKIAALGTHSEKDYQSSKIIAF